MPIRENYFGEGGMSLDLLLPKLPGLAKTAETRGTTLRGFAKLPLLTPFHWFFARRRYYPRTSGTWRVDERIADQYHSPLYEPDLKESDLIEPGDRGAGPGLESFTLVVWARSRVLTFEGDL